MSADSRPYDLILFGATGYTGRLTAEHITKSLPRDLSWAVAGRNFEKLSKVVDRLKELDSERKPPAIEVSEISKKTLDVLVPKTRVLINTVGPFHRYGTPIVEACASSGTHYIDSTGETPWLYEMTQKYHQLARSNGAILIPHCAMDSAPADLVAFALASFIREKYSSGTTNLDHSVQEFENAASGGTLNSLVSVMSAYPLKHVLKSIQPYSLCVEKTPDKPPSIPGSFKLIGSHRAPEIGLMTDSVISIPDTNLVYRSWSLMDEGRFYGPKFNYFTGMMAKNRVSGLFWHYTMMFGMPMILLPPVRWILTKLIPEPGAEPSEESRAKDHTRWRSVAHSESNPSQRVACDMSFPSDMYTLTAILLAEAAMVLLRPDRENWAQKLGGGILTPATLGHQLIDRIRECGVKTEVAPL